MFAHSPNVRAGGLGRSRRAAARRERPKPPFSDSLSRLYSMSERKPYPSDLSDRVTSLRAGSSWRYLLTLYTVACLIEAMFWGQMSAFTPLYLLRLGIAP